MIKNFSNSSSTVCFHSKQSWEVREKAIGSPNTAVALVILYFKQSDFVFGQTSVVIKF